MADDKPFRGGQRPLSCIIWNCAWNKPLNFHC